MTSDRTDLKEQYPIVISITYLLVPYDNSSSLCSIYILCQDKVSCLLGRDPSSADKFLLASHTFCKLTERKHKI